MRNRIFTVLAVLVLGCLLTACGGGSTIAPPGGGGNDTTSPPSGQDAESLAEWAADADLDSQPVLYRGIPSVPLDGEQAVSQVDGDYEFFVLGKDALDYSQCEVSGDAMIINPGGVAVQNPDGIPAWALYRIGGLGEASPLSLNVECMPAGFGHQYSVAVADYTTLDWLWFGPVSLPELEADLTSPDHRFVTRLGNLYFLVVCSGGNTATHSRSTVVVEPGGGEYPPGAPARLVASKGEFEDGVALTWAPGEGADYYEIWRKGADIFGPLLGGPSGVAPEDPNMPPPDPIQWLLLATTEDTMYFDGGAVPGYVYVYKARAVNEMGMSAFSNVDEGWAFFEYPPPPQLEGIHGYVFGSDWCTNDGNCFGPGTDPPNSPPGGICPDLMPLEGATLTIARADPSGTFEGLDGPVVTTQSGADGFYQFLGIEPGVYVIFAELQGWFFPEMYTFDVVVVDAPQQFDFIGLPDDDKPWDPLEGIHGWVWGGEVLGDGIENLWPGPQPGLIPLSGVRITFSGLETDQVELEVYTDEEGFYQVTEIAPGSYIVTAYLEGWIFEPPMNFVDVGDEVPSVCLDFLGWPGHLPPDPDPTLDGIYGMVWGDAADMLPAFMPLAGVEVALSSYPEEILLDHVVTGETGEFAFPELGPGSYLVGAALAGWTFRPPHFIVELTAEDPGALVDFWGYEEIPPQL